MSIDTWRTFALGVVALGQTMFVLLYATFPWYRTFLGRALFFKALALAVIVDTYMIARIVDFTHRDVVFVVLYLVLAVGVWSQFLAFLKVRSQGRQDD